MFKKCVIVAVLSASLLGGMAVPATAATPISPSVGVITHVTPQTLTVEQVRITGGLGVYVNLWGNEAMWVAANLLRATAGGVIGACALSKIPAPYAKLAIIFCGAAGAVSGAAVEELASRFLALGRRPGARLICVQMKVVPFLISTVRVVNRGNC